MRGRHPWVNAGLLVLLAACAGERGALQGAVPSANGDGSWMDSASSGQNLLYISDQARNAVYVFTYPFGKPAGALKQMHDPAGLCSNAAGDVWIVNAPTHVLQYAHGAHQPKATIEDLNAFQLQSCAVDPVTGDLAVVDAGRAAEAGSVAIFTSAKKTPHTYHHNDLFHVFFCAYDQHGSLFVDGLDQSYSFHLMELPRGAKKLQEVTVDRSVGFPGALSWDGKYLALGDRLYQGKHATAIYQIAVSGSTGTVEGTTVLQNSCDLIGFTTPKLGSGKGNPQATHVVAPDNCQNTVRFYAYPGGGAPIKSFGTFQDPFGAAVSRASHG